jgi:hypothetical protein
MVRSMWERVSKLETYQAISCGVSGGDALMLNVSVQRKSKY